MIRIAAKGRVAPSEVARSGGCRPPPTEVDSMLVGDPVVGERTRQSARVEVRMPPRDGKAPDIDQMADALALEQREELFERSRRMPDRVDRTGLRHGRGARSPAR